ncbi:anaerobic ribonucleoside-triphosphate reductase activating protein [uncultured Muribaculum sp.]|uniref:anaerobic ribonucleoside-triphosphate reductase activating protein n=1 Tax=uncultured Muribaculum sp. TaxID=1918613 RepID=UPI00259181B3|nr:anaerobic ribonucleoside-triphosphate reductase activating protein [uncultured Muribaculum sp.]
MKLRVLDIVGGTSVDGPGLRTSIYFAGCSHHCPGCHNPQSWDAAGGVEMSIDEIMAVIDENDFNVTFSGGDPLLQAEGVGELARRLKADGRTVWCYTGYTYEEVATEPRFADLLENIDVLVDGRFVEALRDVTLRFRGSSNQRLVDVAASTPGAVVEWRCY